MLQAAIWKEVRDVDRVAVEVEQWRFLFSSMFDAHGEFNSYGACFQAAVEAHVDALNAFASDQGGVRRDFGRCVEIVVNDLNDQLDSARAQFKSSAWIGLGSAATTLGIATLAIPILTPAVAGVGAVAAVGSAASAVLQTTAETSLSLLAENIAKGARAIEENAINNPLAQAATTMARIVELLKQKLGDERINDAYSMLFSTLVAYTTPLSPLMIDVNVVPQVIQHLFTLMSNHTFPDLLRNVRDASLALGSEEDVASRFGPAMRSSLKKSSLATIDRGAMSFVVIVGCTLRPLAFRVDRGLMVMYNEMSWGRQIWNSSALSAKEASVIKTLNTISTVAKVTQALMVVLSTISIVFAFHDLAKLDARLQPFADAIKSLEKNHHEFADQIGKVLQVVRGLKVAND